MSSKRIKHSSPYISYTLNKLCFQRSTFRDNLAALRAFAHNIVSITSHAAVRVPNLTKENFNFEN